MYIRDHIPCVRCEYDLYGLSPVTSCPECGSSLTPSLDKYRLYFAPSRIIRQVNRCLIAWLLLAAVWVVSGLISSWTPPPPRIHLTKGWVLLIASIILPFALCVYALKCRRTRFRVFLLLLVIASCVACLTMACVPAILIMIGVGNTPAIRSNFMCAALSALAVCLHITAASVVYWIPDRACWIALLLTAALFSLSGLMQSLPSLIIVLNVPLLQFAIFSPYVLSVVTVAWACWSIRNVLLLKKRGR